MYFAWGKKTSIQLQCVGVFFTTGYSTSVGEQHKPIIYTPPDGQHLM
jgi:hypothetical protein